MRRAIIGLAMICFATTAAISTAGESHVSADTRHPELRSGLVYGEGHSYWLTAPAGWVLDNKSGADQGLYPVFYPAGSSWASAPAVMYANTIVRDTTKIESLASFIAADFEDARSESPHLRIQRAPGITTADKKRADVRIFTGDKWGNSEEVAYVGERRVVVLLTLTSKTPAAFARSIPAFESLVRSYAFFTEDVVEGE